MDPENGAGLELQATCWGMHVDEVEDVPGQPHLQAGCTITAIDGTSLLGLEDEDYGLLMGSTREPYNGYIRTPGFRAHTRGP